jgi:phosphatidylglycerophosphate synthase
MASVYDLKPKFQSLLRPLIAGLARAGFTPNKITLMALLLSVAVGSILPFARGTRAVLLLLPSYLFVRMALNAIDGMMARELNMASRLGAVLNEIGDVLSDLALYLPLAIVHNSALWPVVAFSIGAALTEFCGVLVKALGTDRRYDGPMGKSDRAFFVSALGLVTFIWPIALDWWPWLFGVAAALEGLTCWNRLSRGLAQLKSGSLIK